MRGWIDFGKMYFNCSYIMLIYLTGLLTFWQTNNESMWNIFPNASKLIIFIRLHQMRVFIIFGTGSRWNIHDWRLSWYFSSSFSNVFFHPSSIFMVAAHSPLIFVDFIFIFFDECVTIIGYDEHELRRENAKKENT